MKDNKIQTSEGIIEAVNFIFEHKANWTQFINHFKEKKGVGSLRANKLWNEAWKHINTQADMTIAYNVQTAWMETENLKNLSLEAGDRRTYLEALKYQGRIQGLDVQKIDANVNVSNVKLNWGSDE